MSTMFEQNKIETEKQLRNEGKSEYYGIGIHVGLYFMDHLIKYHHNILFPLMMIGIISG